MPHASPRRALAPLALVGSVLCFNPTVFAQAEAQSPPSPSPSAEAAPADPGEALAPDDAPGERVSPLVAHQRKTLQSSLEQVSKDRQEVSTLLPWLVTGIGVSMIVVSLILGAEASIGCGDSCKGASAVPAWLAVFGTTVGAAGMVWTLDTERDIDRIESREYRIKTELERLEWHTAPRQHSMVSPRLSLRGSF
jgi:hypothetical protein